MRNSKLIVCAAVAIGAILGVTAASAADLAAAPRAYSKAPVVVPAPVFNWTGFYIGINGGGGWGQTDWLFTPALTTANHSTSGGLAGGQIGYNWQAANWVFGLEADGDWANIKGSTLCPNPAFTCASNTRDLASFRGRVGYAAGPVLFYGTGGLGYANSAYSALTPAGAPPAVGGIAATGVYNTDRWGYAAGAGIEYGFTPNWSAKIEYMHYGFGTVTSPLLTLSVANTVALGLNIDTVKVGVNYRFGGPVVAKY
jgi:outer membrane immunogenic protein